MDGQREYSRGSMDRYVSTSTASTSSTASYHIQVECAVSMEELIYGAEKTKIVETSHLADWETPILNFKFHPAQGLVM